MTWTGPGTWTMNIIRDIDMIMIRDMDMIMIRDMDIYRAYSSNN